MITTLDWIVILAYFLFIAAVGLIVGLKVKDTGHYFLGRREFSKWLMIGQSFSVGTHPEMPVSLAGAVSNIGFSGIWFQWKNLFATPFFWIFAPIFRRIRRTTIAELTEDRYGVWMGRIYSVFALIFFTINAAAMLKGAGKVISQAVGGQFGVNEIVIAMTVIFVLYSFIGGLVASAWTDIFQGFLIIVLSFMLIPLGWSVVGGLDGMKHSLEAYKFSLAAPEGIGVWFIAMLTINGLIGIMAQPHMLAAVGTGKDEYSCRVGFFYGNFVKRVCTVGWAFVGLIVAALLVNGTFGVNQLADVEDAFGFACRQLLFPGALGLLIASVLAATMAASSAFMVNSGALFTEGLYRRHLVKDRPDGHYLWVGRLSGFLITMLAVLYAVLLINRVLYSFLLTETMATFMGISILGGMIWRRATRWGALASLLVAFATNFAVYRWREQRFDHWDPTVFLIALVAGIAALVLVSLATRPEPSAAMDSFFTRLETPTELPGRTDDPLETGERQDRTEIGRATAAAGQQLLLLNLIAPMRATYGHSFWRSYGVDLRGFAIGLLWSLLLIGLTWLILKL